MRAEPAARGLIHQRQQEGGRRGTAARPRPHQPRLTRPRPRGRLSPPEVALSLLNH